MKMMRVVCCSCVLLLALVVFAFSHSAQASGGGGGGTCASSGVPMCSIIVANTGQLVARTTVQILATGTCAIPAGATLQFAIGDVGITQASGKQIVQAFNSFTMTACDGTAETFVVSVTPQPGSPPFHGGPATATGNITIFYIDASGNSVNLSANIGPQLIHIKG